MQMEERTKFWAGVVIGVIIGIILYFGVPIVYNHFNNSASPVLTEPRNEEIYKLYFDSDNFPGNKSIIEINNNYMKYSLSYGNNHPEFIPRIITVKLIGKFIYDYSNISYQLEVTSSDASKIDGSNSNILASRNIVDFRLIKYVSGWIHAI